ncbi:Zinc finger and SCAN domain-containing protein 29 [Chelonia mydas]|uniref:Zinc finger and SCAN domain-containing protein 29 n=1 Tax=Chelonia mydas TaxID=8469 RepID=M7B983_CHEMY|nr:Zinc finger and SCAN domain-containing protein 29 [Chelonia mydas]
MPAPRTRRSPAWSNAELLDLIGIWGEEAVQSQLRSSCQNCDTYGPISRCMIDRGHDQDTLQCRVKVKELQNAYHKAREANCCSGTVPMSCQFYKELDAILGGDPTSTEKDPVDTSLPCVPVESGPSQEEAILDEQGAGDPEAEDDSESRDACSQELYSTPEEPSQSELGEVQTGEQAPEIAAFLSRACKLHEDEMHNVIPLMVHRHPHRSVH